MNDAANIAALVGILRKLSVRRSHTFTILLILVKPPKADAKI